MVKETKVAKNIQVNITSVEVETSNLNPSLVNRIRFKTSKGDITWKPKIQRTKFVSGLKVLTSEQMDVTELPDSVLKIGQIISEKGGLNMNVCYTVMEDEVDGEKKVYRFITSQKTFDRWSILPDEKVGEEKVMG